MLNVSPWNGAHNATKHRFGGWEGAKIRFSQIEKEKEKNNTKGKHTTLLVASKRNGIGNTIKKRHIFSFSFFVAFFRVDDAENRDRESQWWLQALRVNCIYTIFDSETHRLKWKMHMSYFYCSHFDTGSPLSDHGQWNSISINSTSVGVESDHLAFSFSSSLQMEVFFLQIYCTNTLKSKRASNASVLIIIFKTPGFIQSFHCTMCVHKSCNKWFSSCTVYRVKQKTNWPYIRRHACMRYSCNQFAADIRSTQNK